MSVSVRGDAHGSTTSTSRALARHVTTASLGGWAGGTILLFVLAVGMPAMFAHLTPAALLQAPVLMAYFVVCWSAFRLARIYVAGRETLVALMFWVFVYVWLGLAALAETVTQTFPLPNPPFDQHTEITALITIVVGLVAYDLGSFAAGRVVTTRLVRGVVSRLELVPRRVWWMGGIGILAVLYFTATLGLATRFSSRQDATASLFGVSAGVLRIDEVQRKVGGLVRSTLLWLPIFLAFFLLVYLRRTARQGGRHRALVTTTAATLFLGAMALMNVLANNPISNPRFRFGAVALAILAVWFPLHRARQVRAALVVVLLMVVLVFPIADAFRYDNEHIDFTPLDQDLVHSPDFAMYQMELNGVVYVNTHGHTDGRQVLGAILSFVPRSIWKDKAIETGNLVSRVDYLINASSTLWTEMYVDGGWVLVFLAFLLYGYVSREFDELYIRRSLTKPSFVGAAVPLFAAFQTFLLRGALQPAVGELVPVAVLLLLCMRRRRTRTTEGTTPRSTILGHDARA